MVVQYRHAVMLRYRGLEHDFYINNDANTKRVRKFSFQNRMLSFGRGTPDDGLI